MVRAWPSGREAFANVFFSPFSIRTALGMTQVGARGETATQMREALRTSSSGEALYVACAEIIQRLNAAGGGQYEIAVANSLWGQDGAPLLPGFLDVIAQRYDGSMNLVDFRHAAEAARVTVNHAKRSGTCRLQATKRWIWSIGAATCPCWCFFRTERASFGISNRRSPRRCSTTACREWVSKRSSSSSHGSRPRPPAGTEAAAATTLTVTL
jgi:serpin (serine protease inhibitor)